MFGKTHLYGHEKGMDMRLKEELLEKYGFCDINEIAGPGASAYSTSHMTLYWQKNVAC